MTFKTSSSIGNALGMGVEAVTGLGIKGLISLGCLGVGIGGVTVGVNSSGKLDRLETALAQAQQAEMQDVSQGTVRDEIIKLSKLHARSIEELQQQIKELNLDDMQSVIKELNIISKKIDAFNLNTVIEKWSNADWSSDQQSDSSDNEIQELIQYIRECKSNYQDIEQKFNSIQGNISRRLDSFYVDIEEIKNNQAEILEEIKNNQAELTDINQQTFDILEKMKDSQQNKKKVQIISNLVEIDIKNTSQLNKVSGSSNAVDFEYLTHGTVTKNSFVEHELKNNSVNVDSIADHVVESDKVEVTENNSVFWLVETDERSIGIIETNGNNLVEITEDTVINTVDGYANSFDVEFDSSHIELNFNSSGSEINGSQSGLTVEEN